MFPPSDEESPANSTNHFMSSCLSDQVTTLYWKSCYRIMFSNFVKISLKCFRIGRYVRWVTKPVSPGRGESSHYSTSYSETLERKLAQLSPVWCRQHGQTVNAQAGIWNLILSLHRILTSKTIYMYQAHPTGDLYDGLHFLFIYSLKLPRLQVSHGWNMELSRFIFLQNYGINLLNFLSYC